MYNLLATVCVTILTCLPLTSCPGDEDVVDACWKWQLNCCTANPHLFLSRVCLFALISDSPTMSEQSFWMLSIHFFLGRFFGPSICPYNYSSIGLFE